jgi:glutamate racemase
LYEVIVYSIKFLENYKPKLVILASMTPSIQVLDQVRTKVNSPIIGVMPPIRVATRLSKRKNIGIMATQRAIFSQELDTLLRKEVTKDVRITKFNASQIIELIENGLYILDQRKTFDNNIPHTNGQARKERYRYPVLIFHW